MGLALATSSQTENQGRATGPAVGGAEPVANVSANIPAASDEGDPVVAKEEAFSQGALGAVTVPQADAIAPEPVPIATLADQRVATTTGGRSTPGNVENITGVKSPEALALINASLRNQVAALQTQIQGLLQQITTERNEKSKAVLDATLAVENKIAELRSLLQTQAEQSKNDKADISSLTKEKEDLRARLERSQLELKEAYALVSPNASFAGRSLGEDAEGGLKLVVDNTTLPARLSRFILDIEGARESLLPSVTQGINAHFESLRGVPREGSVANNANFNGADLRAVNSVERTRTAVDAAAGTATNEKEMPLVTSQDPTPQGVANVPVVIDAVAVPDLTLETAEATPINTPALSPEAVKNNASTDLPTLPPIADAEELSLSALPDTEEAVEQQHAPEQTEPAAATAEEIDMPDDREVGSVVAAESQPNAMNSNPAGVSHKKVSPTATQEIFTSMHFDHANTAHDIEAHLDAPFGSALNGFTKVDPALHDALTNRKLPQ